MKIKTLIAVLATALTASFTAQARIATYALPAVYDDGEVPLSWNEINTHTWDVFTSFDDELIFGYGKKRFTMVGAEFFTSTVVEGRKVGDSTMLASIIDRGAFFGGEGYMDLYGFAPFAKKYAAQIMFLGGWKYKLTEYIDLDIGGNIVYADKKIAGPGFTGLGGSQWRGDIYVGLVLPKCYVNPFIYGAYEPSYDAWKLSAGISPNLDLYPLTAIKGLSIETQLYYGMITANNWAADDLIAGNRWKNSYSYLHMEANLVYVYDSCIRTFVGVGWSYNDDGKFAPNGAYLSPNNCVWFSCGVGYIF